MEAQADGLRATPTNGGVRWRREKRTTFPAVPFIPGSNPLLLISLPVRNGWVEVGWVEVFRSDPNDSEGP